MLSNPTIPAVALHHASFYNYNHCIRILKKLQELTGDLRQEKRINLDIFYYKNGKVEKYSLVNISTTNLYTENRPQCISALRFLILHILGK